MQHVLASLLSNLLQWSSLLLHEQMVVASCTSSVRSRYCWEAWAFTPKAPQPLVPTP